jgi:hypothetical protein
MLKLLGTSELTPFLRSVLTCILHLFNSHSPSNPGSRRLPVSSSCMAACLMARVSCKMSVYVLEYESNTVNHAQQSRLSCSIWRVASAIFGRASERDFSFVTDIEMLLGKSTLIAENLLFAKT